MEVDRAPRCRVDLVRQGLRAGHKFMDNRISARVALLEARMLHFCAALEAATGCPAGNPVGLPTQVCPRPSQNSDHGLGFVVAIAGHA